MTRPVWLPFAERARLAYDVRRSNGRRETVWLLRPTADWRDELEGLRDAAVVAGFEVRGGTAMVDGRSRAVALSRGRERLELTVASRQGDDEHLARTDFELALVFYSGT